MTVATALVLLAAALPLGWWWSSRRTVAAPSCGRCGHDVRTATGDRCPECGAELLDVGMLTPAMGRTAIPRRRIAVACVLWLAVATGVATAAGHVLASADDGRRLERRLTLTGPASGAYASVSIEGDQIERGGRLRFTAHCLRIRWNDGRRSRPLRVRPAARDAAGPGNGPLLGDPIVTEEELALETVLDWGRRIGLDPSDPVLRTELTDIHRVATTSLRTDGVVGVPTPGFAGTGQVSAGLHPDRSRATRLLAGGTGVVTAVLGATFIARRHRAQVTARRAAARTHLG